MKKDEIIVPGFYAYLLRVDYLHHTQEEILEMLEEFIKEEKIEAFHCYEEIGTKSQKLHIQAIVWSEKIYTPKMSQDVKRTYFKSIYNKSTRAIAFTDARKPQNLASYSMKDSVMVLSNLDEEDLAKIPRWKNIKEYKDKEFKENLEKKMRLWGSEKNPEYVYNVYDFYHNILTEYKNQKKRAPTRATFYNYALWYHDRYSEYDLLRDIGIIPNSQY